MDRLLVTAFEVPLFDGLIEGRARLTRKEDSSMMYVNCTLTDIDLHRAAEAFSEKPGTIAGRLNGRGFLTGSLEFDDMSGDIDLRLSESNLAEHPVIGTLYNSLNLKLADAEPRGYGRVRLRFQGRRLGIRDFYYYNRGVEVLGAGAIEDFLKGNASPVEGTVLATTRPLKELDLPGVETLDKIMYFAQQELTTVKVDGTLGDVQVKVVALPQVQSFLNKLLGGGGDDEED